jgi:hypothetical protein
VFPIRAVEDDHVDRPGVEVRQRMKLTGTNSSIGLIVLITCAQRATARWTARKDKQLLEQCAFRRPGGHGGAAAPVPIPNTAVKRPSAYGTSS